MNKWIKKNITLPVILTIVVMVAGAISAVSVMQSHAEDTLRHVNPVEMQEEYVPRTELDHRLDDMQREQKQIGDGVERIEQMLMERD